MNFKKIIEGINSFDALKSFEQKVMGMDVHYTTRDHLLREATRHFVEHCPQH